MRAGKPCSAGSGSPFMPTARMASRPSVTAAMGVLAVQPSTERQTSWSAPGWTPARASRSRQRARRASGRCRRRGRRPRWRRRSSVMSRSTSGIVEQVGVGQRERAVDHAVDAQRPGRRRRRAGHERGVDPVEVGVRHPERGDAADADVDRAGKCRCGVVGRRQPDGRARGRDVAATTTDDLAERPGDDREAGHRQDPTDDRPSPRHDGEGPSSSVEAPRALLGRLAERARAGRRAVSRVPGQEGERGGRDEGADDAGGHRAR